MSQMEIPTAAEQQQKLMALMQQVQQMQQQAMQQMQQTQAAPQAQAMAQAQNPDAMQQLEQQYMQLKGNIEDEQQKPTVEQVEQFIRDYRTTAFVLDIETDSTIQADENAEKQRRGEFMGMMAQLLPQLGAADRGGAGRGGVLRRAAEVLGRAVPRRPHAGRLDRQPRRADRDEGVEVHRAAAIPRPQAEKQKIEAQGVIEMKKLEAQKAEATASSSSRWRSCRATDQVESEKMQGEFRMAMFEAESKRARRRRRYSSCRSRDSTRRRSTSTSWSRASRRWRSTRRPCSRSRSTRRTGRPTWRRGAT